MAIINPNASQQGGLNQVAAQGAGSRYSQLTPEELDKLFGYNKDATVTYQEQVVDPVNGDESGKRWADVTRAANLEDLFGKADLSKMGYQKVAAGDSGLGAWVNQKTGDVIVMGDYGKEGRGYSNTAYRTTLADFNKGLEGFGANWFRGYNPETGRFEGDKANGDPFADAMWGAMDYAPGLRKATSTAGAAAGDLLERWGSGFAENVGEHFGDEFEKRGERNADGDYKTSGEISYERGQEGRGGGVDRAVGQGFSGASSVGGGLGALFGAIGASGNANNDLWMLGDNQFYNQQATFDDYATNNAQSAMIGTLMGKAAQGINGGGATTTAGRAGQAMATNAATQAMQNDGRVNWKSVAAAGIASMIGGGATQYSTGSAVADAAARSVVTQYITNDGKVDWERVAIAAASGHPGAQAAMQIYQLATANTDEERIRAGLGALSSMSRYGRQGGSNA